MMCESRPTRALAGLLIAAALCAASPRTPSRAGASAPERVPYRLVLLWRGPAWTAERSGATDSLQAGHMANIRRMWADSVLLAAGPFAGDGDLRGLFVFREDSLDDLAAEMARDPAIAAGRLRVEPQRWFAAPGIGREYRERSERDPAAPDSMERFSFVTLRRGPRWTANATSAVARVLRRHAAHLATLARDGTLVLAGPIEGTGDSRGVLVFAADTTRVRRLLQEDPAVRAGRFVADIRTWWTARGNVPGH